jgi:hypothetical protein
MDLKNIPDVDYKNLNEDRMEYDFFYRWKAKEDNLLYLEASIEKIKSQLNLLENSSFSTVLSSSLKNMTEGLYKSLNK